MKVSREVRTYLAVGTIGFVIDAGLFNLLSLTLSHLDYYLGPIIFKAISTITAIIFTYYGNARWTFNENVGRKPGLMRMWLYGVISAIGVALSVMPLYISRYLLGFNSLVADNVSGNIIGVGLALVFRFYMNRRIVFLAGVPKKEAYKC